MNRTAIVILTWNRITSLKTTLHSFLQLNPGYEKDIIIVDNGSTDGTVDYLKKFDFDIIFNKRNRGAQLGKFQGWSRALEKSYDFIIFIEDDFPCIRTVPIVDLENYLDRNTEVGQIRMNDKPYLKHHMVTKLPVFYQEPEQLNSEFTLVKSNYHFTCHPTIFRTSLIPVLEGCVEPSKKVKIDVNFMLKEYDSNIKGYKNALKACRDGFKKCEFEYMRLYMTAYKYQAQLFPYCFRTNMLPRKKEWTLHPLKFKKTIIDRRKNWSD